MDEKKPNCGRIWVLLVHHDFQDLGPRFSIRVDTSPVIDDLKQKVKEKRPEALSRVHVDSSDLIVWKTKSEMIIDDSTSIERLVKILKRTWKPLSGFAKACCRQTLNSQTVRPLLAQLPGLSRIPTVVGCVLIQAIGDRLEKIQSMGNVIESKVDENFKYKDLFLRATTNGKFMSDDVIKHLNILFSASFVLLSVYDEERRTNRIVLPDVPISGSRVKFTL